MFYVGFTNGGNIYWTIPFKSFFLPAPIDSSLGNNAAFLVFLADFVKLKYNPEAFCNGVQLEGHGERCAVCTYNLWVTW